MIYVSDFYVSWLNSAAKFSTLNHITTECTDRLKTKSKMVAVSCNSSEFPIVIWIDSSAAKFFKEL